MTSVSALSTSQSLTFKVSAMPDEAREYAELKVQFGLRLAALRVEHGLSQRELALRLPGSTDGPQVSRWERGEAYPVYATRLAIAHAFRITVQELEYGSTDRSV
jgi:DNA-binding XRE family transcriptional regulator